MYFYDQFKEFNDPLYYDLKNITIKLIVFPIKIRQYIREKFNKQVMIKLKNYYNNNSKV